MSTPDEKQPEVARVDYLVDENGARLDVPDDSALRLATDLEETVGATGPNNWWRMGLIGLAIVIAILLLLQLLGGNAGTDMVPGTPTAAPQNAAPPA